MFRGALASCFLATTSSPLLRLSKPSISSISVINLGQIPREPISHLPRVSSQPSSNPSLPNTSMLVVDNEVQDVTGG